MIPSLWWGYHDKQGSYVLLTTFQTPNDITEKGSFKDTYLWGKAYIRDNTNKSFKLETDLTNPKMLNPKTSSGPRPEAMQFSPKYFQKPQEMTSSDISGIWW